MRDITIPTSKLTGKAGSLKTRVAGGLNTLSVKVAEAHPGQAIADFRDGLKGESDE